MKLWALGQAGYILFPPLSLLSPLRMVTLKSKGKTTTTLQDWALFGEIMSGFLLTRLSRPPSHRPPPESTRQEASAHDC